MKIALSVLPLALSLLVVPSVFASDGQVLISQSLVMASGGFPYHITQPGSYKLSGNLTAPVNTAAIQFDASDATVDLNGFNAKCSFNESAAFEAACITDAGQARTSLTVENGSVSISATAPTFSFGRYVLGIFLQKTTASTLESVHLDAISTNYNTGGAATGQYFILRRVIFSGSASPPVSCPSVLESNINATLSSGASGSNCIGTDNYNFVAVP